jgi:hypothetical protein
VTEPFKNTVIGIVALGVVSSLIATYIWTILSAPSRSTITGPVKRTVIGIVVLFLASSVIATYIWSEFIRPSKDLRPSPNTIPGVIYRSERTTTVQTPPLVPLAPPPKAPTFAQKAQLADKFGEDVALNADVWTSGTRFLTLIAEAQGLHLVPVQANFGRTGMTLSGVSGLYQFTGVQSVRTVSPPISLHASAMGTVANGCPIELYLVSADLSEYIVISGNLNPENENYHGVSLKFTSGSHDLGRSKGQALHLATAEVDTGRWYVISINLDADGYGGVTLADDAGTVLATETHLRVGRGPFHVVLGQSEGWPHTAGANEAIWSWVEVN